jgi:hypothetical protein
VSEPMVCSARPNACLLSHAPEHHMKLVVGLDTVTSSLSDLT